MHELRSLRLGVLPGSETRPDAGFTPRFKREFLEEKKFATTHAGPRRYKSAA